MSERPVYAAAAPKAARPAMLPSAPRANPRLRDPLHMPVGSLHVEHDYWRHEPLVRASLGGDLEGLRTDRQ